MKMKKLKSSRKNFEEDLKPFLERGEVDYSAVEPVVREIIDRVRLEGDDALLEMAARFDGANLTRRSLKVSKTEIRQAYRKMNKEAVALVDEAALNIRKFHREQLRRSWYVTDEDGTILGQNISPMESAGLYVPGGTAPYPSSLLMNAVPAQVAGVEKLVVTTPATGGVVHPLILVAADRLGIGDIFKVGGAQAVAALAYGTDSIPKVDKIVGPGNIYVSSAKRAVYGMVDIDMIAGPSEIFIVADDSADPSQVAADLLSQAEHDLMATSILITVSEKLALQVDKALKKQLAILSRAEMARTALEDRGATILVRSIDEAFDLVERLGPEHLEVLVEDPLMWLPRIKYSGSTFIGPHTPEALGDYLAGPNHVLPTGGASRFSSPLGVDDFLVMTNILYFRPAGFQKLAMKTIKFAELEGLDAHALSVKTRLKGKKKK
jgi:histidinol dehydrogenase